MIWFVLVAVALLCVAFLLANAEEPAALKKSEVLARIHRQCPQLPWKKTFDAYVVKPEQGSGGRGVNFESQWSLSECRAVYGECMRQGYHPGNVELRMLRNVNEWSAVGWYVPSEEQEPPVFAAEFDWMPALKECIDAALPLTPFLALDIRADGDTLSLLEVNGVFGLTYDWLLNGQVFLELMKWLWVRILYSSVWSRLSAMARTAWRKFQFRNHPGRVWF